MRWGEQELHILLNKLRREVRRKKCIFETYTDKHGCHLDSVQESRWYCRCPGESEQGRDHKRNRRRDLCYGRSGRRSDILQREKDTHKDCEAKLSYKAASSESVIKVPMLWVWAQVYGPTCAVCLPSLPWSLSVSAAAPKEKLLGPQWLLAHHLLTFTNSSRCIVSRRAAGNTVVPQQQMLGVLAHQADAAIAVWVSHTVSTQRMAV